MKRWLPGCDSSFQAALQETEVFALMGETGDRLLLLLTPILLRSGSQRCKTGSACAGFCSQAGLWRPNNLFKV